MEYAVWTTPKVRGSLSPLSFAVLNCLISSSLQVTRMVTFTHIFDEFGEEDTDVVAVQQSDEALPSRPIGCSIEVDKSVSVPIQGCAFGTG